MGLCCTRHSINAQLTCQSAATSDNVPLVQSRSAGAAPVSWSHSWISTATAMWYVYIVQCDDRSLYTGITKDLDARLAQHNAGDGAKYTRARRPVQLVYSERAQGRGLAQRREFAIKRMQTAAKHRLIANATGDRCANGDGL